MRRYHIIIWSICDLKHTRIDQTDQINDQSINIYPASIENNAALQLPQTHVRGKWWRGSWTCSFCSPHQPTVGPRPPRTPAWRRWPPWSRTYFSGAPLNCCRRKWRQSSACTRWSCASRTPGTACRSEGREEESTWQDNSNRRWTGRVDCQTFALGGALMYQRQSTASVCSAWPSVDIWMDSTKPSGPLSSKSQAVDGNSQFDKCLIDTTK